MSDIFYIAGVAVVLLALILSVGMGITGMVVAGEDTTHKTDIIFYEDSVRISTPGHKIFETESEVTNWFFENNLDEIEFENEGKYDRLFLEVGVIESNNYGNLKIYLNDKLVYNGNPFTTETIEIDYKFLRSKNKIRVEADNPGLRLWAKNIYKIKISLFGSYGGIKEIKFDGNKNLKACMSLSKTNGVLTIFLNDVEIFKGEPQEYMEFEIPRNTFSGDHKMKFIGELGSLFNIDWMYISKK